MFSLFIYIYLYIYIYLFICSVCAIYCNIAGL